MQTFVFFSQNNYHVFTLPPISTVWYNKLYIKCADGGSRCSFARRAVMKILFIQVRYHLKKGTRQEFYRRFRDNNIREFSSSEEGNLEYELYLPLDSDDDICILEKWKDEASQLAHLETLHYAILSELKLKYVEKTDIQQFWIQPIY